MVEKVFQFLKPSIKKKGRKEEQKKERKKKERIPAC